MEFLYFSFPENAKLWPFILLCLGLVIISNFYYKNKILKTLNRKRIKLLSSCSFTKTWIKNSMFLLGLIFIYIALLGPKWGYQELVEHQKVMDVVILIDVSKSMSVEDVKPNRLERAKLKINDLIDLFLITGEYRVGLTVFAGSAFVYSPLTKDYGSLHSFVFNINQNMISEHGTDFTLGIKTALSVFPDDKGDDQKVILVFTDGESHERDVIKIAEEARAQGVIIYTIGVGTPNGELVPIKDDSGKIIDYLKDDQGNIIISKLDQSTLSEISDVTGGTYFSSSLEESDFKNIYYELDRLGKRVDRERIIKSKKSRFQIFVLVAIFFFSTELLFTNKKKMVT